MSLWGGGGNLKVSKYFILIVLFIYLNFFFWGGGSHPCWDKRWLSMAYLSMCWVVAIPWSMSLQYSNICTSKFGSVKGGLALGESPRIQRITRHKGMIF